MAAASSISRCQAVAMHMGHWLCTVRRSCTRICLVWLSSLVDEEGSQTGRITVSALKYILWEDFFGIITTEWLEKFKFFTICGAHVGPSLAAERWDKVDTRCSCCWTIAIVWCRSTSWTTLLNVLDSGVPRLVRRAGPGRRRSDWWTAQGGMWRSSKWRCGIMLPLAKTAPDDLRSRWRHGRRSKFVF